MTIALGLLILVFSVSHARLTHIPRSFWGMVLSLYYRQVHFDDRIPESDVATIVVANHCNAFIDPFALQVALNRPLVRTIRADWLQHWLVKWFAKLAGAVPLAPRKIAPQQSNHDSFKALQQELSLGKWVVFFPEGISHNRSRLHPFRNGAAALAKHYLESTGQPVRVVQLSLFYGDKSRLGSDVWVQLSGINEYHDRDDLTSSTDISEQWRQTIQAQIPQKLRAPQRDRLTWLKSAIPSRNSFELSSTLNADSWQSSTQVTQLHAWLKVAGLDLQVLRRHPTTGSQLGRLFNELMVFILGLPIALLGMIVHLPVATVHYFLVRHHARAEDKWASNAYVIGTPVFMLFWGTLSLLTSPAVAFWSALSGIYALYYWRSWERRKLAMLTVFQCLSYPNSRRVALDSADSTFSGLLANHRSMSDMPSQSNGS